MFMISAGRRIIVIVLVYGHDLTKPDGQSKLADG